MGDVLRIGLLGCGRIGIMHAANINMHPKTKLAAVYDIDDSASKNAADTHGAIACGHADEIFANPEIDAVLIATATETHADYIESAVAACKPVLCEKPIDLDLARVNLCRDRIADSTVPVQIGFNRRFDPGHRACRNALLAGEVGELRQLIIISRDPAMPPSEYCAVSGGIFRDMTIHDFDMARFILGEEPVEVVALANRLIDPELMNRIGDYDTAMITMRTATGRQCIINNSRVAVYGYDQRVEILGSDGMLQSENQTPHALRRHSASQTAAQEPYQNFFVERYREAYWAEIGAFADCVMNGTQPEVGFEDGRRALVLAEAAYLSLSEKRVVAVDEVD
ncbi:MAG: inositol 2-dehydrogenase [Rhodobacteraceae bacterium]|nr:inositol 2-dehydrogenase [Paracoccaceae bacterium]